MSARANTSSSPGIDRELLGFHRAGAGPVEHRGEVLAHLAPRLLEPGAGVELLAVRATRRREVAMGVTASPSGTSNASASECAGSVEQTSVRSPDSAARRAVAAATVVLPTPPLPVKRRMRMSARGYRALNVRTGPALWAVSLVRPCRPVRNSRCSRVAP